jgi:hypothetical protein
LPCWNRDGTASYCRVFYPSPYIYYFYTSFI